MTLQDLEATRAELVAHIRHASAQLLESLDGLSEAQMIEESIDGWSPRDHLSHCAVWHDIRAAEILRISSGFETAWPEQTTAENNAFNDMTVRLRRGHSLVQVGWEYQTALQRVINALQAAEDRGLDESLYGDSPPRTNHDIQHAGWIRRWRQERGY